MPTHRLLPLVLLATSLTACRITEPRGEPCSCRQAPVAEARPALEHRVVVFEHANAALAANSARKAFSEWVTVVVGPGHTSWFITAPPAEMESIVAAAKAFDQPTGG